jgi:ribosomal protein S27E
MDVIFNCPKCDQELAVDSSGSGTEIACPSCGENIIIPESGEAAVAAPPPAQLAAPDNQPVTAGAARAAAAVAGQQPVNAISSSAAAKVQMHLKVDSNKAPEVLISKPLAPLEVAAKETDKKLRVKTIKHTDCIEVGHDKFDEFVTNFLVKVGEKNIKTITPLTYTHIDIGSQKLLTDYAVMIVYRG